MNVKQSMKDQQSGKRSELLVLELKGGKMMGFLNGCSFAILSFRAALRVRFLGNGFDATNYIATVWPLFIFNEFIRTHSGLKFSVA